MKIWPKLILLLPLLFSTILVFRLIFESPLSADSYTHLGIGKFILENRRVPAHQDISFKDTDPSLEFVAHSWLGDLVFYVTSLFGFETSLVLLLLSVLTLSFLLLRLILKMLGVLFYIQAACLSLAALLAPSFWKVHPLIFTIPLFLSIFYLYLKWKRNKTRLIWLTPLIFVAWANLAGGFIFIPISFIAILFIFEFLLKIFSSKGSPWHFLLILLVSIFATLLNPLGFRIWQYFFTIIALIGPAKWSGTLLGALIVTTQSNIKNAPSNVFFGIFVIYMLASIFLFAILLLRKRREFFSKISIIIPLFTFFVLAFNWIRFIPLTAFATLPILAVLLSYVDSKAKNRRGRLPRLLYLLILFVPFIISLYLLTNLPKTPKLELPENQAKFIKENNLKPNVLTTWDISGYIFYSFYPERTILDAQDDLIDESEAVEIFTTPSSILVDTINEIISKNNINTILTNRDFGSLAVNISKPEDWALVYIDYSGFIFVKKDSVDENFLRENALTHLDLGRNLGFDPNDAAAAAKELEKFTDKYPESSLALGQLATIYRIMGNSDKAEQALRKIPQEKWNFVVRTEMGRVKATKGECKEAEQLYLEALKERKEQDYSRAVLDLAVLYAGCLKDKEKAKHYFERYNSFILPPGEHARVKQIAEQFGIKLIY